MMLIFEALANVVWIASILYIFVSEVLGQTEDWWGYMNTAFFLGMIIGGVICARFVIQIENNLKRLLIFYHLALAASRPFHGFRY